MAAIVLLFTYSFLKKSSQAPTAAHAPSTEFDKEAGSRKGVESKDILVVPGEKGGLSGEAGLSIGQAQQAPAGKPAKPTKIRGSWLVAGKELVPVEVDEGQRTSTTFTFTNNGDEPLSIDIYKSDLDQTQEGAEAELERLLKAKDSISTGDEEGQGAMKESVFAGAPGVMPFPQHLTLNPSESKEIKLTVDAGTLESGNDHVAYLYAVGDDKENSTIVPIEIQTKEAPKMSVAKVEVDDGFSADTQGNSNNVANPGEIAAVKVLLDNTGNASAQGLSIGVSCSDTTAFILGSNNIQLPSVGPHSQVSIRILVKVSADANPVYPTAIYLAMSDSAGRKWQASFSAGDPGKVVYPTGLDTEKEENEIDQENQ